MGSLLVTFLTVLIANQVSSSSSDVIKIGTYKWAYVARLGADVTFDCQLEGLANETFKQSDATAKILPNGTEIKKDTIKWLLPSSKDLERNFTKGNKYVTENGTLVIQKITIEDSGIYHCYVELECTKANKTECPSDIWYKHGLNLNGPLYNSITEKYMNNFITAAASSGGVLGLFMLLCLIYKFRYKEPLDNYSYYPSNGNGVKVQDQYINYAAEADEASIKDEATSRL